MSRVAPRSIQGVHTPTTCVASWCTPSRRPFSYFWRNYMRLLRIPKPTLHLVSMGSRQLSSNPFEPWSEDWSIVTLLALLLEWLISQDKFWYYLIYSQSSRLDSIKPFQPITLINVLFKFILKMYAQRLAPIVHRIILPSQTTFVKGGLSMTSALSMKLFMNLSTRICPRSSSNWTLRRLMNVSWQFLREVLSRKYFDS